MGYIFSAILIWLVFYAIAKIKHITWFSAVKFVFMLLVGAFISWIVNWLKFMFYSIFGFGDPSDDD